MFGLLFLGKGDAIQEGSVEVLILAVFLHYFPDNNLNILILHNVEAPLLCFHCTVCVSLDVEEQNLLGKDFVSQMQLDLSLADLLGLLPACCIFHLYVTVAIHHKKRTAREMHPLEVAALAPACLRAALLNFVLRKVADGARADEFILAEVEQIEISILLLDPELFEEDLEVCRHGVLSVLVLRENEKRKFDLLGGVEFDVLAAVHFRRDRVGLAVGLLGLGLVGLSDAGSSHLNNNYSDDKLHGAIQSGASVQR